MSVVDRLATSLKRRDERSDVELAESIVAGNDREAVTDLVKNLTNDNTSIQSDCIKVLYEIGEKRPDMIASYSKEFINLLDNKNNRLSWGTMNALDSIVPQDPEEIYGALPQLLKVTEKGSVITRDHFVNILIKLNAIPKFQEKTTDLLIDQLKSAPANQLPMYAERALPIINDQNSYRFRKALQSRIRTVDVASKRKRIEKVLNRIP